MKNKKIIIICILMILVIAAVIGVVVLFHNGDDSNQADLKLDDGISITYQVSDKNTDWTVEELNDTKKKLEKRAQKFSPEATAMTISDNSFVVQIPGEKDLDKVRKALGKQGGICFCTKAETEPTKKQLQSREYIQISDGSVYEGYYKVWLTDNDIKEAEAQTMADEMGMKGHIVSITFSEEGAKRFGDMTAQNIGQQSYIIYDSYIISAPVIMEAITGGKVQIDGMESLEEAKDMASYIKIGGLKLSLDEIDYEIKNKK